MAPITTCTTHDPWRLLSRPGKREWKYGLVMNCLLQIHLVSLSHQYRLDIVGMTYLKRSGRKVEIFAEMLGEALISKIEINVRSQFLSRLDSQTMSRIDTTVQYSRTVSTFTDRKTDREIFGAFTGRLFP
jgi:hypothetical protein